MSLNSLQFYYLKKTLGISTIIQPKATRAIYKLHPTINRKQNELLFFCTNLQAAEQKELIQKMAQAIQKPENLIVEILPETSPSDTAQIFNNLLTRFQPAGSVIFGETIARRCMPKGSFTLYEKNHHTISINSHQKKQIPFCVLNELDQFIAEDLSAVQERKKQAWQGLKLLFASS